LSDALEAIREITGPVGPLEALLDHPNGPPRAAVVFAHPLPTAGGTMHTKVVFQGAKALTRIAASSCGSTSRCRAYAAWDEAGEMDDIGLQLILDEVSDLEMWAAVFLRLHVAMTWG
jgi:alpha/beta superfamily hydrolase